MKACTKLYLFIFFCIPDRMVVYGLSVIYEYVHFLKDNAE